MHVPVTRKRYPRSWRKAFIITVAAVTITTLGIEASDLASGIGGRLTSSLFDARSGPCAEYEVLLRYGSHALCMDQFEASVGSSCPHKETESELATIDNVSNEHCVPVSAVDALPWRFVSFTQAQQLCARAGKRLPTATEWYRAAAGLMVDDHCVLTTAAVEKSTSGRCASPAGVSDLVGNVWEWVDETVTEGKWNDRYLPASGYVDSVDEAGMVLTTSATANRAYGSDYAWINQTATRGIVRGGFYGSRDDGGIFAQNLTLTTDFTAAGVGFRCVQDVH